MLIHDQHDRVSRVLGISCYDADDDEVFAWVDASPDERELYLRIADSVLATLRPDEARG